MRLAVYAGTSALVAAGALLKAFHQRPNFYSATVYLSQSNACVLILTNLALVCTGTFIYGLQRLFYGPLRQIEIEQLTEKAWYAVLDTLLAMPSLSHDVSGWMLAIFVLLIAGKLWGWIGEGRVDILEQQPPQNPRLFHARLSSSLVLSIIFDACLLRYCIKTVRDDPRPGMMVIFTFEFAILTIFSLFTFQRYILALIEAHVLRKQTEQKIEERKVEIRAERERIQQEQAQAAEADPASTPTQVRLPSEEDVDENEIDVPGWEEKRRWLFGLELATDFIKLIIYTVFFVISLTFMGLPMHIMRDVYLTFTAFAKRIQDYRNYRQATQNMNARYSDATAEELSNDNTCIVCRETMEPWRQPDAADGNARRPAQMNEGLRAKKLPCGHILHLRCLKAWLERQQACPTCRRPVIGNQPPNATTQPRIEGPNAGAQPGPAGDNARQPGNNPGQPQPRANRLRMLNLGPIRIGVYNGPAHQIQEALGQRQNAQARQASDATGSTGGAPAVLGTQSTQIQLMQVEERLLHDARNLAIEQTQLLTVRALEAELARLRAFYDRTQQSGPVPQPFGNMAPQIPIAGLAGIAPIPMPLQAPFAGGLNQLPQVLQPLPGQVPLGAGNAGLPQGMVLPEGWSVTPLHRIGGPPQQVNLTHPAQTSGAPSNVAVAPSTFLPTQSTPSEPLLPSVVSAVPQTPGQTSANPEQEETPESVSTQIQEPATESLAGPIQNTALPLREASPSLGETTAAPSSIVSPQDSTLRQTNDSEAQPSTSSSWSFEDLEARQEGSDASPETSSASAPEHKEDGPSDKGKGKAVTMEDVQDAED